MTGVNVSKSNKATTALAKCELKHCNVPLVKTAANTLLPHEAAIASQHFHALPFCHADNSIQHKSTFLSKETQQNILIGYTLPHDQNILTSQRLQLEHLAQAQSNSMHKLDELSHENLHFEKELITGIPLWTYRAGKQRAKLWIPASQREIAFKFAHCQTHPGKRETKRLCKERYFWKGLPADVEQFYKRCPICCQENSRRPRLALRPFQVPERKFAIVHIDLVSFGHDRQDPRYVYALTLVDRWTRYMTMCPLLDTTTKAVVSAIEHN